MTKILVLDAGHGGEDGGAQSNGLREKDLTLDIAKRIQSKLKPYSIKVIMTRTNDKYLTLTQRTNIANKANAELFLSIHINAGGGTGFESYIYNGNVSNATRRYQSKLHDAVMKQIDVRDRGKKRANFAVVRQTKMPAVLTECLFIDTKSDANKLKNNKFLNSIAQGHVDGIVTHLKLKKTNTSSKPSKPTQSSKPSSSKNPTTKHKANMKTNSVVEFLQSINQPFSYKFRKKLADIYGVGKQREYSGTTAQNVELLQRLRRSYRDTGKIKTSSTSKSSSRYTLPTSTLRRGNRGNNVKLLQRALNKANFKVGKVDGIFGKKTEDAVRRFQKVHDAYNVDGIYGKRTRTRLDKMVNK